MTLNDVRKLTKLFLLSYNGKYDIIATSQPLNKYTANLKRSKKISDELREIISNKYTYTFIEDFEYTKKQELNDRLNALMVLQNNRSKPIEQGLNNFLYNKGCQYEEEVFKILKRICEGHDIKKTTNRYSKYDFYDDKSKTFFELKTNTYSINEYPTAVINVEKLGYTNLVLIFGYTEFYYDVTFKQKVNYYFIEYDEEVFKNYRKRYIVNHTTGRSSLVIDIPTEHLKPLETLKLETNNVTEEEALVYKNISKFIA